MSSMSIQPEALALAVEAEWDPEAGVWVATSEDVPGLATEAETLESLMAKLRVLVPELLEANGGDIGMTAGRNVPLRLVSRREEILHLPRAWNAMDLPRVRNSPGPTS